MNILKNRKTLVVMMLTALLALAGINEAKAQVPSIPRKTQKARPNNYYYNSNVAWGTQYDWLSTRYASYSDIQYMDRGQIRVLKNSIYARHGRRFQDSQLRSYFNSQSWYRPTRNEIPAREFNKYENYNITFLHKYE